MRLLLDTHVFLWLIVGDERLKSSHEQTLRDPGNEVFLSVVSAWEITVKYVLGRLSLPLHPAVYLPTQRERHGIEGLPLDEPSVAQLANLPDIHRDPFDRMLICQARQHKLTLVTADRMLAAYPVTLLNV